MKTYVTETGEMPVHCLECGEQIYGRSDKKFCGLQCRNAYHSHIRAGLRMGKSITLNGLNRNYRILDNFLRLGITSCSLRSLKEIGFDPDLITHQVTKNGTHLEYRCFDIAYFRSRARLFGIRRA